MGSTFDDVNNKIGDIEDILHKAMSELRDLSNEIENLIEEERENAVEEYINSQEEIKGKG